MELRPGDPRGPFYLGNVALARGHEIDARELYARSLEINPQFVPPLVQLARYLDASGRRDEALVGRLAEQLADIVARSAA